MLVFDDNKLMISKMKKALLEKSNVPNKEEHLSEYKKIVSQIDSKAFSDILGQLESIDEHNRSLEDEVNFLKEIKESYSQLFEKQCEFRNVCELYGDGIIELSDLSRLNIQYVDNRINTIEGYLINDKNIKESKEKIQKLNEELVREERKKDFLSNRLLRLEDELMNSFSTADGRYILNGQSKYISVVSEYEKLGFDFRELVDDKSSLNKKLLDLKEEEKAAVEKFEAAEICYNSNPNESNKEILNEINIDTIKVKYRLSLLKILELLSKNCDDYDDFIKKRREILDLIKYRKEYISKLGIHISYDPFDVTKTNEQLNEIKKETDNSKIINRIRKEIGQLGSRIEFMDKENNNFLISLSDTKEILRSNIGLADIDISSVSLEEDDEEKVVNENKEVTDNQVVKIRSIPLKLQNNLSIINRKTLGVIKRCNQMFMEESKKLEVVSEVCTPELVIVPKKEIKEDIFNVDKDFEDLFGDVSVSIDNEEEEKEENVETVLLEENKNDDDKVDIKIENIFEDEVDDIFETVVPFDGPVIFTDKSDDSFNVDFENDSIIDDVNFEESKNKISELKNSTNMLINDEMPDAFWVTQEEDKVSIDSEEDNIISFDEQIDRLLSDNYDDNKVKKLEFGNNRKAA